MVLLLIVHHILEFIISLLNTKNKNMKKILTTLAIVITMNAVAQNTCNIINNATLTADTARVHKYLVSMDYLNKLALVSDTSIWHYVAITKSSTQGGKIYVDGQL